MSPPTAKNTRTRQLARIHVLAKELGLDRAAYEAVLWTVAGVQSAAELDDHGRRSVIQHLVSRLGHHGHQRRVAGRQPSSTPQRPLLRKIAAQLKAADRPWEYALALARRLAGKDRLEFCTDAELGKIVAALDYDARRHGRGMPK